ncbi:predicted protein [Chaetoceros tenuissimus]|uniref:Uncharacterized protein n=1 Tax=Chaetoceros tenuissimus TaxID=426638 RepID=A0AAD3CTI0_9STRA|nr:predicted protein [Chaetoceros tenuissimus]
MDIVSCIIDSDAYFRFTPSNFFHIRSSCSSLGIITILVSRASCVNNEIPAFAISIMTFGKIVFLRFSGLISFHFGTYFLMIASTFKFPGCRYPPVSAPEVNNSAFE